MATKTWIRSGTSTGVYTLTYSGATKRINVSDSNFTITGEGASGTILMGGARVKYGWYFGNSQLQSYEYADGEPRYPSISLITANYFNASNKTTRTINFDWIFGPCYNGVTPGTPIYDSSTVKALTAAVSLNAPPTYTASSLTIDTATAYAGITNASVSLSNIAAQYGGDITKIRLEIGEQYVEKTSNIGSSETLTIALNASGTFTPTVVVTDSRGQTTTKTLSQITVNTYQCAVSGVTARRIDASTGKLADEGTNALLQATFTFTEYTGSNLTAPTVKIGANNANITWYTAWDNTNGFSGAVSNWSSITSGTTLYGKITDTLAITDSYIISIKPSTNVTTAKGLTPATVTANLAQSFYLIAGRADGHGLGIGKKPTTDRLEVAMESVFEAGVSLLSEVVMKNPKIDISNYQTTGDIDKDIYDAIVALGWKDVLES